MESVPESMCRDTYYYFALNRRDERSRDPKKKLDKDKSSLRSFANSGELLSLTNAWPLINQPH